MIVEDYNPPRIWFYLEFYVRFCLEPYDPKKLNNRYIHLTNNSVQKYNSKVTNEDFVNESMWSMDQMKTFLDQEYGEGTMK